MPERPSETASTQSTQGGLLQHLRFSDFDVLRESIEGWDLDWRQLDKGPLEAEVLRIVVGAAQLNRSFFNRHFEQRGSSPLGIRTLGLIGEQVQGTRWCGRELDDRSLPTFHSAGDFEAVSRPGFTCHTLSFPEELLVAVGETLGIQDVDRLLGRGEWVATCDREEMKGLRRRLHCLCEEVTRRPSVLESPGLVHELEFEIPARILKALATSRDGSDQLVPPVSVRRIAVDRARSFIEQKPFEPITVEALSRAARVSWRTLEYAFREHFGVSPKSYLTAIRLNGVRRDLRAAERADRVADVANKWGYWHMGQLAADYRKMFGELPSETLSRSSRHRGRPGDAGQT